MEKDTAGFNRVACPADADASRVAPSEDILKSPEGSSRNSFVRVFMYNDTNGCVTTAIAVVCMVASGTLLPLMNFVFGKFVTVFNDFITGRKTPDSFRSSINQYTLYFVYLFVAKFVLSYIWTTIIAINAIRLTRSLRLDFLNNTLRQEIGYFDSAEPGSIPGSINRGGNLVTQGISEKLGLAIQATTTFFSAFIVAFAVQWKLTLISLCIVPTILIVVTVCVMIDSGIEQRLSVTWEEADKLAEEVFASIRNAHAFWAFPKLSSKFERIMLDARVLGKNKPPIYAVLFCIQFFCIYAGYGLAFWQGIRMYHRGEIDQPGDVVTVILAVLLAAQGLTQIAPQIMVLSKAIGAANDLFKRIDRQSKIDSLSSEGSRPSECHGNIQLAEIDFAYPSRPNVQVLNKLNLIIHANKTTAIVGPSGSGKSTIIGLLERWYSPLTGTIMLDGRAIADLNLQWLRTNIRVVQQDPILFSGTIFQNVAYGLSGTPQADSADEVKMLLVQQACKAAYAHDFIAKLPEGYYTHIGERGAMLSGGQKQRLAIARSIISDPRVLLLDEATSALDPTAERIVQQALNNVAANRTVVVIAHRLSTIRDADNIVVMAKGMIVEQGTHSELIERGGVYSNLILAQDLGQKENGKDTHKESDRDEQFASTKTQSAEDRESIPERKETTVINHNLVRCLLSIIKEQRSLWLPCAVVGIAAVIGGGTYPALAVLFSRILEAFAMTGQAMLEHGDFYALMFFVMALGNLFAYAAMGWMSSIVSQHIMSSYRLEIFTNTLRQEITFFDDPDNGTGALVSRLSTEPAALQELLSSNIALILTITVNLISSCVLAISYGWKLGLVLAFGALPPLVASGYVRIRLEFKLDDDTASRFASSASIAAEAVAAIRTVASLAMETEVLARYEDSLRSIAKTSVKSLVSTMFWYALSQSISFLSMALGFWYGGRLISFGEYTPQQFYTVFVAVIFSGEAAAALFQYTSSITAAQGAANYIFNLRRQVGKDMRDNYPPGRGSGDVGAVRVECKDLGFSYPRRPRSKVIKDVSLSVSSGQFVAFVGASGCGKTTMVSLLERFYEPTSGSICLNGVDSRSIHLGQYRRHIALVEQEPVLYQGSLRENISLGIECLPGEGTSSVTDDDILEACRQANIDTFIASLPDGLSTRCGSQGLQLSGGQRQRIAMARALIRKPRLLLLDEATSSLDTESERAVQAALDAAAKREGAKRTIVAVAHRLSSIRNADVIFVFHQGRIVETGSHDELIRKRGLYYQMCLAQSLE